MKNSELSMWCGARPEDDMGMSRRRVGFLIAHFSLLLFCSALHAQAPTPPAAPKNLVLNGGFERVNTFQNLYDGVDANGNLRVPRASSPVYREGAALEPTPFAASPCFVDVNGDGLPDLVVCSPLGMLYWYPNVGKKGEPKFEHGRMVQTYLGPGARIHVADWNGDGKPDIVFGNVDGDVNLLLNLGTGGDPRWIQSPGKPRWMLKPALAYPGQIALIQKGYEVMQASVSRDPINVGNYAAPCFADWNKDGIPDLIVGEGSYSANSVRVWINTGSKSNPVFKDEMKFYLAFGEGREQLAPAVCDWNGDGIPDLIVGDREGHVSLYLGTAEAIKNSKKIEPVEFTKFITVGGRERIGSMVSLCVCDWNNDGIPDLIYGTTSGMVMVALGKGKREDPEFPDPPFPVKGVDFAKDFKQPSGWENPAWTAAVDGGAALDLNMPQFEAVSKEENPDADIKEGKRALHFSWYDKCWGTVRKPQGGTVGQTFKAVTSDYIEGLASLQSTTLLFVVGKDYEFSFWRKGEGMKIVYQISYQENLEKNPKRPPVVRQHLDYFDTVSCSGSWSEYRKTFRLAGTKENTKEIGPVDTNGKKLDEGAVITFWFMGTGDAWLDDVKLMEVTK